MNNQNTTSTINIVEKNYIINVDYFEKYGSCQTFTYVSDGVERAAYTFNTVLNGDGVKAGIDLPVEIYLEHLKRESTGGTFEIWTPEKMEQRTKERNEKRKEESGPISVETYWWRWECLPPCRAHSYSDIHFFHISERICANLVTWNALCGDKAYELIDEADASINHIVARFRALHSSEVAS